MKKNHLFPLGLILLLGAIVLSFMSCAGTGGPSGGGKASTFTASVTGGTQ